MSANEHKDGELNKPKSIERLELYTPSNDTPKRKQKLLVHYSQVTPKNPTFRQLFSNVEPPIENSSQSKLDKK